jgi:T5SS/PEP-CTERM-associated repeat protein
VTRHAFNQPQPLNGEPMKAQAKPLLIAILLLANTQSHLHAQLVADGAALDLNTATNLQSNLIVGTNGGNTTLNIIGPGGAVTNGSGYIGFNTYSTNNTVTVRNIGASWNNRRDLSIGHSGSGNRLVVSNGAELMSVSGTLGFDRFSSNNTAVVTGTGSRWNNRGPLWLGRLGSGNQLVISNGAELVSSIGVLGQTPLSSNNTAVVTGTGSLWTNRGRVDVLSSGNTLLITNGAILASGSARTDFSTSNNKFIVTGPGSRWSNGSDLFLGSMLILTNDRVLLKSSVFGSNLPTLTYGGSLTVRDLGPDTLTAGDSFKLFSTSNDHYSGNNYSGAFSSIELPPLGPGLDWTNRLLVDGSIAVVEQAWSPELLIQRIRPAAQAAIVGHVGSGSVIRSAQQFHIRSKPTPCLPEQGESTCASG